MDQFIADIQAREVLDSRGNPTIEADVLLAFSSDWRWGQSSQDSYWYDSVKLYRQVIIGDWEHVIKNYKTLTKSKPITSNI